jgi:hypothetical protein
MRGWVLLVALAGCGGEESAIADGAAPGADAAIDAASAADAMVCPREMAAADRTRKLVVSRPYGVGGSHARTYEVLDLLPTGELVPGLATFELGRSTLGRIAFTPDGAVGIVAQEDGSLGVFRFDQDGTPVVVHAAFTGSFYATQVVMDALGERAFVVDENWRENGGGIYAVRIGCDGALVDEGLLLPAKLPAALIVDHGRDRALLASVDVADSPAGHEAHVLSWTAPPSRLSGIDVFSDDEMIMSEAALTADGRWLLIGDNGQFSTYPNRVAIIEVQGDTLTRRQVIEIEDPISIVAAPGGALALVASGFGDALWVLSRGPDGFTARELGSSPLPGTAVVIERGALTGRVFLGDNDGIRRLRFTEEGVEDLGTTALGTGIEAVPGSIGVQP